MTTTNQQDVLEMTVAFSEQNYRVEKAMSLINSVDLSMVKAKLMDEEEGQGWDMEYANYAEKRYRRYLCMIFLNPDGPCVPTKDVDLFWHQHILDTRAYADDCQKIFGEFLHHFPYFGMRGEEDAKNLQDTFEETKIQYAQLFGDDYCSVFKSENNSNSSTCHKCSGSVTCHKCTSAPPGSPDTITCHKCKSK